MLLGVCLTVCLILIDSVLNNIGVHDNNSVFNQKRLVGMCLQIMVCLCVISVWHCVTMGCSVVQYGAVLRSAWQRVAVLQRKLSYQH